MIAMKQKLVFWDWTGTLIDESRLDEAVCKSMEEEVAKKNNISFKDAEKRFRNHLKKLENTWEWHDYVLHGRILGVDWRNHQEKHLKELILLPYAKEILKYARESGCKNVLATNAVRAVILLRAGHAGLLDLFDAIVTSDDVKALKSEGKHFEYGLKNLNGDPESSFSIGDNPVQDILSAKRLGLRTIYCDFGQNLTHYHSEHISNEHMESTAADYTVADLSEVKGIINGV
ncbi:MAG: HAD hydrolase-like protein [Candidatus Aenigmarchaeota archaeon]|nr:HAD hydrolase-like protein [Candidatus Aenigmarchaeota archaeon]